MEPTTRLNEAATRLAECNDIMPENLAKHRAAIYNACLDMIYVFEEELMRAKADAIQECINLLEEDGIKAENRRSFTGSRTGGFIRKILIHAIDNLVELKQKYINNERQT